MGSAYQFHSWRVFVLVCAFPSVFAIGALTTQPESPRFFLEVNAAGAGLGEGQQGLLYSNTHCGFGLVLCGCFPSSQGPRSGGLYLASFVLECVSRGVLWVEKPWDLLNHGWLKVLQAEVLALALTLQFKRGSTAYSFPLQHYLDPAGLGCCPFSDYMLAHHHHFPWFQFSLSIGPGDSLRPGLGPWIPPLLPKSDDILLYSRLGSFRVDDGCAHRSHRGT